MKLKVHIMNVYTTHTQLRKRERERETCLPPKCVLSSNHLFTGQYSAAMPIFSDTERSIGAFLRTKKLERPEVNQAMEPWARKKNIAAVW